VGAEVVTTDGTRVGEVTDVLHTAANSVLVVGDHLIPLVREVVVKVLPRERITIEAIPGLLAD
jgi:16S rRNA processing protein RimM